MLNVTNLKIIVLNLDYMDKLREYVNTLKLYSNFCLFVFFKEMEYSFHWIFEGLFFFLTSKRLDSWFKVWTALFTHIPIVFMTLCPILLFKQPSWCQLSFSIKEMVTPTWSSGHNRKHRSVNYCDTEPALKQHSSVDLSVTMEMFKMFNISIVVTSCK